MDKAENVNMEDIIDMLDSRDMVNMKKTIDYW